MPETLGASVFPNFVPPSKEHMITDNNIPVFHASCVAKNTRMRRKTKDHWETVMPEPAAVAKIHSWARGPQQHSQAATGLAARARAQRTQGFRRASGNHATPGRQAPSHAAATGRAQGPQALRSTDSCRATPGHTAVSCAPGTINQANGTGRLAQRQPATCHAMGVASPAASTARICTCIGNSTRNCPGRNDRQGQCPTSAL